MGKFITVKTSVLEIMVFLIFVAYLLFPVETPESMLSFANSTIGMGLVILLVLYLVLYSHPVLAIVAAVVAYEFFRRNANADSKPIKRVSFDLTQSAKDKEMKKMNPPQSTSLEEDVIKNMAPLKTGTVETSFKPVTDNTHHAMSL